MIFASDFSFIERAIVEVWVWLWFIQRVWTTDKFASLRWNKIRNFDLKSIITLLILLMLPAQAIFDVIWSYLKYTEGLYVVDQKHIITKPVYYWTKEHIFLKSITEYVLACGFAFQIGTLALMQAFWSHLSSQIRGKPFMRSWKFKFYFGWVLASIITFPLARFLSAHNFVLVENVPVFIFSIELLVIFFLGIKNGKRLNYLLKSIQQQSSPRGQETSLRIHYFIEMNKLLSLGALLISIGFLFITIDAMFNINYIGQSKPLLDLFLIHANFGSLMLWCTMILIIYPRYYITGSSDIKEISSEMDTNKLKGDPNSFVINVTTTTSSSRPTLVGGSSSYAKIEKSVTSLLEQQQQQIDIYRHKTSTSISSTSTFASSNVLNSPLIPPPIYESSVGKIG